MNFVSLTGSLCCFGLHLCGPVEIIVGPLGKTAVKKQTGALMDSGWIETSSLMPSLTKSLHYSHDISLNALQLLFLCGISTIKRYVLSCDNHQFTKLTSSWLFSEIWMQMLWIRCFSMHLARWAKFCRFVSVGIWLHGYCINMSTSPVPKMVRILLIIVSDLIN